MKFCFVCIYSVLNSSGLKEVPESVRGWYGSLFNTYGLFLFPTSIPVRPLRASLMEALALG